MADRISFHRPLFVGHGNLDTALDHYADLRIAWRARGRDPGFAAMQNGGTPAELLLFAHDFGRPHEVVAFVLWCAERFGLRGRWAFCWAHAHQTEGFEAVVGGVQILDLGVTGRQACLDCHDYLGQAMDAAPIVDGGVAATPRG